MINHLIKRKIANKTVISKRTILIVDDSKPMLSLLENVLNFHFSVIPFPNAENALDWLNEGNHVDLIISDIKMDQMSGIDFARNLQVNYKLEEIPLIFLTGINKEDLASSLSDVVHEAYIQKPFNPSQLIRKIEEILSQVDILAAQ